MANGPPAGTPSPSPPASQDVPQVFTQVFAAELAEIGQRREAHYEAVTPAADPRRDLVGLALSGGGIRSATFCLGLLQGLDRLGMLRMFDYLSTVSGGGFAGGWLSAWLMRPQSPPAASPRVLPDEKLEPDREALYARSMDDAAVAAGDDPVHHLRLFSNYLTPRKGLLSGDTWRAVAVVSRNLVLTWLVLVPIVLGAILAGQLYYVLQPFDPDVARAFARHHITHRAASPAPAPAGGVVRAGDVRIEEPGPGVVFDFPVIYRRTAVALMLLVIPFVALVVTTVVWMRLNNAGNALTHAASFLAILLMLAGIGFVAASQRDIPPGLDGCGGVFGCLAQHVIHGGAGARVVLAIAAALALGIAITAWRLTVRRSSGGDAARLQRASSVVTRWHGVWLVVLVMAGTILFFSGFAHELIWFLIMRGGRSTVTGYLAALTTAATAAGALFTAFRAAPSGGADTKEARGPSRPSRIVFALTPPLVLVVLATLGAWATHSVLRFLAEPAADERLTVLTIVAFIGLGVCLVFASYEATETSPAPTRRALVTSGFIAGATSVALLTRVAMTSGHRFVWVALTPEFRAAFVLGFLGWLMLLIATARIQGRGGNWRRPACLAVLSMASLIVLLAAAWWIARTSRGGGTELGVVPQTVYATLALLVLGGSWAVGIGWMADPNALSLHTFYRSRLVRAYLGASNPRRGRGSERITDAVEGDDMPLHRLATCSSGGPYHLVNTTLNLVGGRDLSSAQRTAASFVFTRQYCGSLRTGYRPTEGYMNGQLTVGAALAASGAAVSPNMGAQTPTASLAMLLALLNVRLGFWVPTPNRVHWRQPQARLWPYYLLRDMLSQTTDVSSYCYVTDGGHFDNTGLYSLVERGCRFIVLADNGADPQRHFDDIGAAVRRCRIDFGAEIDLELDGFRSTAAAPGSGSPPRHGVVGEIRYADAHVARLGWDPAWPRSGTIVWLKPSLLGADPADVRQYGFKNTAFPQQATTDQWFDEAQFESYRRLGEHYARCVLRAGDPSRLPRPLTPGAVHEFFQRLAAAPLSSCAES